MSAAQPTTQATAQTIVQLTAQATRRLWLARALLATVAATVLAYGATSTVELDFAALGFAALTIFAAATPIAAPRLAALQALALALLAALLGLALWQAIPLDDPTLVNPAWRALATAIEGAAPDGGISVAPGLTLAALPALAAPFLAFVVALACCQSDEETLRLWRALAHLGALAAGLAILQQVFWPDLLLFEPKRFYLGDLTGSFVNRNTAGTFFGVAFIINLGLLFADLRRLSLAALARTAAKGDFLRNSRRVALMLHALAALGCAAALFLTRSRGAVGATLAASLIAASLTAARRMSADSTRADAASANPASAAKSERRRRRGAALAAIALVITPFLLFGGRPAQRMEALASGDGRWCAFSADIAAIKDNWPFGAGFGAFQDVFPAYRDADCTGILGVWDRAHNVFLEGLLGFGLPFVIAAAIVYAALGAALIHGARVRRRLRFLPVAGLAVTALVTLHSLVDFSLQIPGVAVYVAAVLGAAAAAALGRDGAPETQAR